MFQYDSGVSKGTRIYFNKKLYYGNGYNLSVTNEATKENVAVTVTNDGENYVDITGIPSGLNGKKVKITFTAK